MTLAQWIGVWVMAAAFMLAGLTFGVVTIGLYMAAVKQDERRYGVRRGRSRPEAGRGRMRLGGDGTPSSWDDQMARVGWVGIEKVED